MSDHAKIAHAPGASGVPSSDAVQREDVDRLGGVAHEEQLFVERLRDGDEEAFGQLLDRYHGGLLRLAMVFVPSQAVAEEVVQETWLGVITGLAKFEGRSSLKTWIFRILVNRAKTRGVREHRSVPWSAFGEVDPEPEPAVDPARFKARRRPCTVYTLGCVDSSLRTKTAQ